MYRYLNTIKVWLGPSDSWAWWVLVGCPAQTYLNYGSSYGFNANANRSYDPRLGWLGLFGRNNDKVEYPARVIEYAEYVANAYYGRGADDRRLRWHRQDGPWAVILFADGHVGYVLMLPGSQYQAAADYSFLP